MYNCYIHYSNRNILCKITLIHLFITMRNKSAPYGFGGNNRLEKGLSKGELNSVIQAVGGHSLRVPIHHAIFAVALRSLRSQYVKYSLRFAGLCDIICDKR